MAYILVLEDDPDIRKIVVAYLRSAGHEVADSGNGYVGCRLMDARMPDLLIADLALPAQDGLQIIFLAHGRTPRPKILAMSGGPDLEVAKELGADELLEKPFKRAQLLAAVERLLNSAS